MNTIKYAVYAGWIGSKSDDNNHWINADMLMSLYKVTPKECIVIDRTLPEGIYRTYFENELIGLYPDHHGDYKLPTE